MSKYRIRFFSSFCDSDNCKNVYERLCEVDLLDNYGPDKEIYITTGDDYTHAIIMNTATPDIIQGIPKENVIGIAFEPPDIFFLLAHGRVPHFLEYAKKNISKYFIGSIDGLPSPFIQKYSFMWHITPPRTIHVNKNNRMSIMVSDKTSAPGHSYRHTLVNEILNSDLDIHIYGRGCRFYSSKNDSRLKGEFTNDEPYESYQFHICIENFQTPNYTSEKYTNCILWGTTPIYWGATNIDDMFPDITIKLSGDVSHDIVMIRDIMNHPEVYKKTFSQNDIRPKINILKNLDNIFSVQNI
jgi:hypothetical protein